MPQLFWCWKAPPRPARPKAPHVPVGHVWWHRHVFHANSMSCHTWTWCHGHGKTSRVQTWHVIHGHAMVMARHAMFASHVTMTWQAPHEAGHAPNSFSTIHFLKIGFKLLSVSKSWPPLYPCGENVKRWNLQWHWTLPHFWILLPSTALFGQLPSHLGAIKLWGPIPPSSFLQISWLLPWSLADQGTHLSSLAFLRGPDSGLVLMLHEFGTPMTGMQVHGGKRNHDSNMTHMGNMANKHEYPRSLTWQAW